MIREILSKLALSLVALVISLIGVELILRTPALTKTPFRPDNLEPRNQSPMSRPDLREPRSEIPPKSEAFRILVVGDSYAWGDGVHSQDAFPFRLEQQLNIRTGDRRFEVVNWSHAGWSTRHQVKSLRGEFEGLDPDLVLLNFVLNDPEPRHVSQRRAAQTQLDPKKPSSRSSIFLFEHSRLYAFVWTRVENTRIRRELVAYYFELFDGETWKNCRWALGDLNKLAAAHDVPLAMVIWPLFDTEVLDEDYPYLDLIEKSEEAAKVLRLPVLDLFDSYRGLDGRRLSLVPYTDPHPSELAHRIGADAILDFLVINSLVPISPEPASDPKASSLAGEGLAGLTNVGVDLEDRVQTQEAQDLDDGAVD